MSTDPRVQQYYYCLDHHRVEPFEGCKSANRLGPYATMHEAANALQTVQQRNVDWENDPRYKDQDEDEDEDEKEGWGPFHH